MRLIQVLNGIVTIVNGDKVYNDKYENFSLDSSINLGITDSLVYDSQQKYFESDGKVYDYPNDDMETKIDKIDMFIEHQTIRRSKLPKVNELQKIKDNDAEKALLGDNHI